MLGCGFNVDTRNEAEGKSEKEVTVKDLLYTKEVEYGIEIRKEFKRVRKEARGEGEQEDRGYLEWGSG